MNYFIGPQSRVFAARRRASRRPLVEALEVRRMLAVITVTGTGDAINANDGQVTLREAITAANRNANVGDAIGVGAYGADTIDFDIPGAGVQTIRPTSALPTITDPLTIDGYTQPGSAPNTNPVGQGLNGTPLIEIDGEDAGDVRFGMIQIETHDCTVRGLVINRAQGIKISLGNSLVTNGNNRVEGCYIGPDATGTTTFAPSPNPNRQQPRRDLRPARSGNTIGGTTPAARNLISGNVDRGSSIASAYGIVFQSGIVTTVDNWVQGNLIGTDVTGTHALGNDSGGVAGGVSEPNVGSVIVGGPEAGAGNLISGNGGIGVASRNGVVEGNFIGTDVTGTLPIGNSVGVSATGNVLVAQNTIAFNTTAGVDLPGLLNQFGATVPTTGNLITQNSIFSNFGPGIGSSSYLNDSPDADGIQNYPTLASVMPSGAGTQVVGTLASKPSSNYRLEFFASAERQEDVHDVSNFTMPGEFAEGRTYLGTIDVTTDANGQASFTADLPALPAGQPFVTATATDITDDGSGPRNNTSPFSPVAVLGGPSFVVTNTGDSGLGTLREAIINANLTPGAQTITFAIPATDARHFYYRDDGVSGGVTTADIATTTATSDATIADIDPDWAHSWFSIMPSHDLPRIINTVTIDGYSQPGSLMNTLPALGGLDTVLRIELDGANAPGDGLNLGISQGSDASNSQIDGLAINRFGGDGIELDTLDGHNVIAGNFIGTDVSGTIALGNAGSGILLNLDDNDTIGGATPGSRDLISGNGGAGVEVVESLENLYQGLLVGSSRDLAQVLPNNGPGVFIHPISSDTQAGLALVSPDASSRAGLSTQPFQQAPNQKTAGDLSDYTFDAGFLEGQAAGQYAIEIEKDAGEESRDGFIYLYVQDLTMGEAAVREFTNELPQPSYFGIDLSNLVSGQVSHADTGQNGFQNSPVLTSAATTTATTITGTLNSLSNTSFRVEFYSETVGPEFRAGEQSLGTLVVTTDSNGNASFTFPSPILVPAGQFITALATRLEAGTPFETSEFSAGIPVTGATLALTNVPANQTVEATGPAGAVVTFATPGATDSADPDPTVTSTPASGSTFPLGTTTVTCTATDHFGNTATAATLHGDRPGYDAADAVERPCEPDRRGDRPLRRRRELRRADGDRPGRPRPDGRLRARQRIDLPARDDHRHVHRHRPLGQRAVHHLHGNGPGAGGRQARHAQARPGQRHRRQQQRRPHQGQRLGRRALDLRRLRDRRIGRLLPTLRRHQPERTRTHRRARPGCQRHGHRLRQHADGRHPPHRHHHRSLDHQCRDREVFLNRDHHPEQLDHHRHQSRRRQLLQRLARRRRHHHLQPPSGRLDQRRARPFGRRPLRHLPPPARARPHLHRTFGH